MDRERLVSDIAELEKYTSDMGKIGIDSTDKTYYAVSMLTFSIANKAIDIGQTIILDKKLGMPSSYRNIFRILSERGLIDDELFRDMDLLMKCRNMISHEYSNIDRKIIMELASRMGFIGRFIGISRALLNE